MGEDAPAGLRTLRNVLVRLHAVLTESERLVYEREHGRLSAGELLQRVINDDFFAWLRPLSELIVRTDEALAADDPPGPADLAMVRDAARALLAPRGARTELRPAGLRHPLPRSHPARPRRCARPRRRRPPARLAVKPEHSKTPRVLSCTRGVVLDCSDQPTRSLCERDAPNPQAQSLAPMTRWPAARSRFPEDH